MANIFEAICKFLVFIILLPVSIVLAIVGFVLWLPLALLDTIFTCCCAPIECIAVSIINVVENLIKAPIRAVEWAFN